MEKKELKERDFHEGEGHHIPFFIKLAWPVFVVWVVYFFTSFVLPDLRIWLSK